MKARCPKCPVRGIAPKMRAAQYLKRHLKMAHDIPLSPGAEMRADDAGYLMLDVARRAVVR